MYEEETWQTRPKVWRYHARSLPREFHRDKFARTYLAGRPLKFGAHADNECQITRTENTFGTRSGRDSHDMEPRVGKHPRPRNRRIGFHDPAGLATMSIFPRLSSTKLLENCATQPWYMARFLRDLSVR